MRIERMVPGSCVLLCLLATAAHAQPAPLTLPETLTLARERAPDVVAARLAVAEARGRLLGAERRFQSNPDLDLALGNRQSSGGGRLTDVEVGVGQTLEPSGRRTARVAGATAAIAQAEAEAEDAGRLAAAAAASAFYRALFAQSRGALLTGAVEIAGSLATAAERRLIAGDVAVLDVNLARVSLARARADAADAQADEASALGELQRVLGMENARPVAGSLSDALADIDMARLILGAAERPDLRTLEGAVREAHAEQQLGLSLARIQYGIGARYAREEGDQIVMGSFRITLPTFVKGQEVTATATARAARLRAVLEAATMRVRLAVTNQAAVYAQRVLVVRGLEREAMPLLDDTLALAARSYEAGQIGITDVLLLRRELLETHMRRLEALLDAALARVELETSAGVLR